MVSSYVYFLEPLRGFLYTSHNTRFHLPEKRVQNLGLQIDLVSNNLPNNCTYRDILLYEQCNRIFEIDCSGKFRACGDLVSSCGLLPS